MDDFKDINFVAKLAGYKPIDAKTYNIEKIKVTLPDKQQMQDGSKRGDYINVPGVGDAYHTGD